MKSFSIEEAFKSSWQLWKSKWKVLVPVTLVFVFISLFTSDREYSSVFDLGLGFMSIILGIFAFGLHIGLFKMLFKIYDKQETAFKELFAHFNLFWKLLAASILFALIVGAGLILFIVPGVYFYQKYQFFWHSIVDKPSISIMDSFKNSSRITEGVKLQLFAFSFISVVIGAIGAVTYIGQIITLPLVTLASIYVYRHLDTEHVEESAVQTS